MDFQLLHGLWRAGRNYRTISIRAMTGRDEVFLLELPPSWPAARKTSALLERVIQGVKGVDLAAPDIARELTAGDRERLLIRLCGKYLGDWIDLVAICSDPACGQLTEISLSLESLLSEERRDEPRRTHELECAVGSNRLRVEFQLPTGCMEEQIAETAVSEPSAAAEALFDLVILKVASEDGQPVDFAEATDTLREALEIAVQKLEPALDRHSEIFCESCGGLLNVEFNGLTVLTDAVSCDGDIFQQVDRLARVYHWAENDILALPPARRRRYLQLAEESGGAVA